VKSASTIWTKRDVLAERLGVVLLAGAVEAAVGRAGDDHEARGARGDRPRGQARGLAVGRGQAEELADEVLAGAVEAGVVGDLAALGLVGVGQAVEDLGVGAHARWFGWTRSGLSAPSASASR
jgi:hypothetical protein